MTDSASNDPPTATDEESVTFNVKSNQGKWTFTLPVSTTAIDLKNKLATSEYAGVPAESQRLIYSGRVLKDDDTLLSHKVKEGNTMHLVKSAPSNQRQNPANQGTPSTTAPTAQATGVPHNLAAGTGNDPFAALTGARYAGFSQLPSADMFGADGGVSVYAIGPPPVGGGLRGTEFLLIPRLDGTTAEHRIHDRNAFQSKFRSSDE
jgi:ubiquilin